MTEIKFFTPITYGSQAKTLIDKTIENVDQYFHFLGKKAQVIQSRTKDGIEKVFYHNTRLTAQAILKIVGIVLSYFTVIIPLFFLILKAALRLSHKYRFFNPQEELEQGVDISQKTITKIQTLIPKILGFEDDPEIIWLSKRNNPVFCLRDTPEIVFKYNRKNGNQRYENMIKAIEVCIVNQLDLLHVPQAKKITFDKHTLIAEKKLRFNPYENAQENLYDSLANKLNETIRQLQIFITKTGASDISWRNIPILEEDPNYTGPPRIGLIDLEEMEDVQMGLCGLLGGGRRGLIGCINEEQIGIVLQEIKINLPNFKFNVAKTVKELRLEELALNRQLVKFYTDYSVISGDEPLKIQDINDLGLNLSEEGEIKALINGKQEYQKVTMKMVIEQVLAEINRMIADKPKEDSPKGKRSLFLYVDRGVLSSYKDLRQDNGNLWIKQIIEALIQKRYIFRIIKEYDRGYMIQA